MLRQKVLLGDRSYYIVERIAIALHVLVEVKSLEAELRSRLHAKGYRYARAVVVEDRAKQGTYGTHWTPLYGYELSYPADRHKGKRLTAVLVARTAEDIEDELLALALAEPDDIPY